MRRLFLIFSLSLIAHPLLFAQPSGTCECFNTEVVRVRDTLQGCRYYEFEITNDGNCSRGLSNFTMAIDCGTTGQAWNSLGTTIEQNFTDPNNGLWGIKVDGIQGFGEDQVPDSFRLGFIYCPDNDYCADLQSYWEPVVAYKAGQCIVFDTVDLTLLPGFTASISPAPNPVTGPVSMTFTTPGPGPARLDVLDLFGNVIATLLEADFDHQQRLHRDFDTIGLPPGLYLLRFTTQYGVSSEQLLVQ